MVSRVTDNVMRDQSLHSINSARLRQVKNQEQSSSLKRVNRPSDDPAATTQILKIRNTQRVTDQYKENGSIASSLLSATDRALEAATEVMMRAQELAINQSSHASATPESRKAIALEVNELLKQMASIGNTRFGERHIFSGFKTEAMPFTTTGQYLGDGGNIPLEIRDNYYVPVNIPGNVPFMGVDRLGGVNVFHTLERLQQGLFLNDIKMIQSTLEDLQAGQGQIVMARSSVGSRVKALETSNAVLEADVVDKAKWKSELEDADVVESFSNLTKDEEVLKRTLMTSQKLISQSLFDFLR